MVERQIQYVKSQGKITGPLRVLVIGASTGYGLASRIVAAFGLVAGLAWNEAIKSLIEYFYPASQNNLMAKFVYAVFITLVVVVVSTYLVRLSAEKNNLN